MIAATAHVGEPLSLSKNSVLKIMVGVPGSIVMDVPPYRHGASRKISTRGVAPEPRALI